MTPHGSISTYNNHDCRCDACKAAWNAYCKKRREERKKGDPGKRGATSPLEHNATTYTNWGCRCDECRSQHSIKTKPYVNRRNGVISELISRHRDEYEALLRGEA